MTNYRVARTSEIATGSLLALLLVVGLAHAQVGADAGPTETVNAGAPRTSEVDPRVEATHALLAGSLSVTTDPASHFDVPLTEERSLRVEVARLRAFAGGTGAGQ